MVNTLQPIVSNASPLIALAQIERLDLLQSLFTTVVIPPTVADEVRGSVRLPDWLHVRELSLPIAVGVPSTLDPGESAAISLALELGAARIILDDLDARRTAGRLGLNVVGTLGLLILAKHRSLILHLRPLVDALGDVGFYFSPELYQRVVEQAGE